MAILSGCLFVIIRVLMNEREHEMDERFAQIKRECLKSASKDPVALLIELMNKDYIAIHGPEHHVLDGLVCLPRCITRAWILTLKRPWMK